MAKQERPNNITRFTPRSSQYVQYSRMLKPSGKNAVDVLDEILFLINIGFLLVVLRNF